MDADLVIRRTAAVSSAGSRAEAAARRGTVSTDLSAEKAVVASSNAQTVPQRPTHGPTGQFAAVEPVIGELLYRDNEPKAGRRNPDAALQRSRAYARSLARKDETDDHEHPTNLET